MISLQPKGNLQQGMDWHQGMLDRMSDFDLRNAKCTLETDRLAIEEQVPLA